MLVRVNRWKAAISTLANLHRLDPAQLSLSSNSSTTTAVPKQDYIATHVPDIKTPLSVKHSLPIIFASTSSRILPSISFSPFSISCISPSSSSTTVVIVPPHSLDDAILALDAMRRLREQRARRLLAQHVPLRVDAG